VNGFCSGSSRRSVLFTTPLAIRSLCIPLKAQDKCSLQYNYASYKDVSCNSLPFTFYITFTENDITFWQAKYVLFYFSYLTSTRSSPVIWFLSGYMSQFRTNYTQTTFKKLKNLRFFFNLHSGEWSPNWVHSARRPLTGLLYLARVIVRMENYVEWMAGETEVLGENLPRRHFVHHKSHLTRPGFEPGPPRWEASD
jgi:hypothetical protein